MNAVLYRSGRGVVSTVLDVFGRLSSWWQSDNLESKMLSLTLLMKLLLIDASVMTNAQHPAFTDFWAMYNGLLTDRTTTLAFKVVTDIGYCRSYYDSSLSLCLELC